tara:strand:+ start:337 stop:513 length:177 start_codon:yes stop_codon:yes gene_type:complete
MSEKTQYYKKIETGEIVSITHIISDKRYSIPIDSKNMDYIELMKRVDAGELTIEPADE